MPNFPQISPAAAREHQANGALLIDVRTPAEFRTTHLPGAINLPLATLPQAIRATAGTNRPILLYCTQGHRSHSAALVLSRLGYRHIFIIK